MLIAAGILNGINAGLGFVAAALLIPGGTTYYIFSAAAILLGTICLVGAVGGIIGAVFCIKRRLFPVALVGSILGMIFGGLILGIIATILVAVGRNDFLDRPPVGTVPPQAWSPMPPVPPPPAPTPSDLHPEVGARYCIKCGTQLPADATFCSRCGAKAQ